MNFDKWTFLKIIQLVFVIACLIVKRATDVEASRLFLYLQKLSREWKLLNNVTWGSVGASFADATYGGYLIITSVLFISRLSGEIPTHKRLSELLFLGVGAILYTILGGLELFAIDDLPPELVDNGIIIGSLSLITAALFLIDMAGPKSIKPIKPSQFRNLQQQLQRASSISETNNNFNKMEQPKNIIVEEIREIQQNGALKNGKKNGYANGTSKTKDEVDNAKGKNVQDVKKFGIFGKDVQENLSDDEIDDTIPPKMKQHSPVWSKIRKGEFGRYDIVSPNFFQPTGDSEDERYPTPSTPGDPGYVQYTAKTWGQTGLKTPRHSPTQV